MSPVARGALGALALMSALGCGDAGSPGAPAATTAPPPTADARAPGDVPAHVALASTDLAVGRERFAFAILTPAGAPIEHALVEVAFFALDGGDTVPEATLPAAYFGATIPGAGLYVVRHAFDVAGAWGAEIRARLPGGGAIVPVRVRFDVQGEPAGVGIGERPPPTANRTLAGGTVLAELTSDPAPDPDFYARTVDDAVRSGKPTVVVFATPGHCTSRICGPVLDEVKRVKASVGDAANFVHIDVYRELAPRVVADEMRAWGLTTEPWVYVLDAQGVVVDRLEGSTTAREIAPIVEALLAGP